MKDKNEPKKKNIIRILLICIIVIIIVSVVLIYKKGTNTSTRNKNGIELKTSISKNKESISAFFDYPKFSGISVEESNWESSRIISSKKKNYTMELILLNSDINDYKNNQESNKNKKGYEEIKVSNYEGYIYKYTDNIIEGCVLLNSEDEICKYISLKLKTNNNIIDGTWTEIDPIYRSEEIQSILNSLEYESNGMNN